MFTAMDLSISAISVDHHNITDDSSSPPLLPLKWQLTMPSMEFTKSFDEKPHQFYKFKEDLSVNVINTDNSSAMIPFSSFKLISDEDEQINVLKQYENIQYNNNNIISLLNGFMRIQSSIYSMNIPSDINCILFNYYFEEKHKYLYFAYKLYLIYNDKMDNNRFTGQQFMNFIKNNIPNYPQQTDGNTDIVSLCTNLLKYGYIELAAYKIKFFTLFDDNNSSSIQTEKDEQVKFNGDNKFFYKFTSKRIEQYLKYKNMNNIHDD